MSESAGIFAIGALRTVSASGRGDLLGESTRRWLEDAGLIDEVGVVEIDPVLSDTTATQRHFDLPLSLLVNCVVVGGKREGVERLGACAVLATTRADVNGLARRALDVRKASFLEPERAVALTGMEYGAITPIGLPELWPVFVDRRVIESEAILLGSGIRRSKIVLNGKLLRQVPNVEVLDSLGV
jgi:prolyl-tRNA editing enzyme YbaK/EbsC (Cys-tRNA(Pro) deacylase)